MAFLGPKKQVDRGEPRTFYPGTCVVPRPGGLLSLQDLGDLGDLLEDLVDLLWSPDLGDLLESPGPGGTLGLPRPGGHFGVPKTRGTSETFYPGDSWTFLPFVVPRPGGLFGDLLMTRGTF